MTPIETILAKVEWVHKPDAKRTDPNVPTVTHEGLMDLFGHRLRVYRLDDGRAIVNASDVEEFFSRRIPGADRPEKTISTLITGDTASTPQPNVGHLSHRSFKMNDTDTDTEDEMPDFGTLRAEGRVPIDHPGRRIAIYPNTGGLVAVVHDDGQAEGIEDLDIIEIDPEKAIPVCNAIMRAAAEALAIQGELDDAYAKFLAGEEAKAPGSD